MTVSELQQMLTKLGDKKIYDLGTKIYRVLDDGRILMEKVEAYRIDIQKDHIDFRHIGGNNYGIVTPEDGRGDRWGSTRVRSWHFNRKEANKAAQPFLKAGNKKQIDNKRQRIAELEAEIKELEES